MEQKQTVPSEEKPYEYKIGNTTYVVRAKCSEEKDVLLIDIIQRLIQREIESL